MNERIKLQWIIARTTKTETTRVVGVVRAYSLADARLAAGRFLRAQKLDTTANRGT